MFYDGSLRCYVFKIFYNLIQEKKPPSCDDVRNPALLMIRQLISRQKTSTRDEELSTCKQALLKNPSHTHSKTFAFLLRRALTYTYFRITDLMNLNLRLYRYDGVGTDYRCIDVPEQVSHCSRSFVSVSVESISKVDGRIISGSVLNCCN